MKTSSPSKTELLRENAQLRARLEEAEETLRAIRVGEVDALVVGEQVYSLQGAETPYRVLIESMSEGAATLLADGTILYCNQHFAELINAPLQNVMGSSLRGWVAPEDWPGFDALLAQGKAGASKGELKLRRPSTPAVAVQLSFSKLEVRGACGICVVASDLTERKHADEALRLSEQEFRALAEAMPQIVWATRPDGWNVYFNQHWLD
jgi:PAS domain S-box-containing protein